MTRSGRTSTLKDDQHRKCLWSHHFKSTFDSVGSSRWSRHFKNFVPIEHGSGERRAAGAGRSWSMVWRSSCIKANGSRFRAADARSSPQRSSAADDCRSSSVMRILKTSGTASVHCSSAWHMAALSARCSRSKKPLAAGWCWLILQTFTTVWPGGKVETRSGVLGRSWSVDNWSEISSRRVGRVIPSLL